jgi:inorganic pyrophosphatase
MEAVHKLRDCADHLCATIDPEDDWYKELSPGIDGVDAALVKISEWLKRATDS